MKKIRFRVDIKPIKFRFAWTQSVTTNNVVQKAQPESFSFTNHEIVPEIIISILIGTGSSDEIVLYTFTFLIKARDELQVALSDRRD